MIDVQQTHAGPTTVVTTTHHWEALLAIQATNLIRGLLCISFKRIVRGPDGE